MKGYELNIGDKDKPLFIIFGGIYHNIGMPVFEFKKFLSTYFSNANYLLIRDLNQIWYYSGVAELSTNVEENVEEFTKIIDTVEHTTTHMIGNSMGGTASLMYGLLLNVDYIDAFSMQSFLDEKTRREFNDNRWVDYVKALHKDYTDNKYLNFKSLKDTKFDGSLNLYYGENEKLDKAHIDYFEHDCNYNVIKVKNANHNNIVKQMKISGELIDIFKKRIK